MAEEKRKHNQSANSGTQPQHHSTTNSQLQIIKNELRQATSSSNSNSSTAPKTEFCGIPIHQRCTLKHYNKAGQLIPIAEVYHTEANCWEAHPNLKPIRQGQATGPSQAPTGTVNKQAFKPVILLLILRSRNRYEPDDLSSNHLHDYKSLLLIQFK
jgi:hypothetical protein